MLTKSKLFGLVTSVLSTGALLALNNCGGAPDENAQLVTENLSNVQIQPQSAWFGANCQSSSRPAAPLNILSNVQAVVPGWARISYQATGLPDPAVGCDKNLIINYSCAGHFAGYAFHAPEANNQWSTPMDCTNKGPADLGYINVSSATYGVPGSTVNLLNGPGGVSRCNSYGVCVYYFENRFYPDPAVGRDKAVTISYTCNKNLSAIARTSPPVAIGGEGNHREYVLNCNNSLADLK